MEINTIYGERKMFLKKNNPYNIPQMNNKNKTKNKTN